MNNDFLSVLIDPATNETLQYNHVNDNLFSVQSVETFAIKGNMAIVLPNTQLIIDTTSKVLQQYQLPFQYQEHYQKDAEFFDYTNLIESAATTHELQRLEEAILSRIDAESKLLLDIGCGKAWVAKRCLPMGKTVISMDISTVNPTKALTTYPHEKHFGLVADVYYLPIKNNSIDVIIAAEIMEHVPNPKQFVAILYSKLQPNGKLIITTPYNEKIEYNLCVHCNKPSPRNAHLHSFCEANIGQLIPEGAIYNLDKFMNKHLGKLRTHILLKYLPFKVWYWVDKLANAITNKPVRLLIEIQKP